MGIHDRDWYRDSRGSHWFRDLHPVGKIMIVLCIGSAVALVVMNRSRRPRRPHPVPDERVRVERDVAPIHDAVRNGDLNRVQDILSADPGAVAEPVSAEVPNQPLHLAAWHNHRFVAELLIRQGAQVNARGAQGCTPLHFAARYGSPDAAECLLQHDADLQARDSRGFTPLLTAARGREPECAQVAALLLKQGAPLDLHSALCLGKTEEARALLKADPQLVRTTPTRDMLLTDAIAMIRAKAQKVEAGRVPPPDQAARVVAEEKDILEMLVAQGADVNARGSARWPPLFEAVQMDDVTLAAFLIEHGADVHAVDGSGTTLLQLVGETPARQPLADLLRKHGAK